MALRTGWRGVETLGRAWRNDLERMRYGWDFRIEIPLLDSTSSTLPGFADGAIDQRTAGGRSGSDQRAFDDRQYRGSRSRSRRNRKVPPELFTRCRAYRTLKAPVICSGDS